MNISSINISMNITRIYHPRQYTSAQAGLLKNDIPGWYLHCCTTTTSASFFILSNSSYLSALNSYPQTGLYR